MVELPYNYPRINIEELASCARPTWPPEGAVQVRRTQPHTPDEYMEDLNMAADVAFTTRNEIVEMAARGGGGENLVVRMETMAKAADNAVIASGHSHLFLSVNEVQ